jgi:periplasmic divalent cation tolerance protein
MRDDPHVWHVVTTTSTREEADALALGAVGARVAACVQVGGPIQSTYHWDGAVRTEQEWSVVLKTTAHRYPALESYLRSAHPYEVPEILAVPVIAGNPEYLSWVREQVTPAG